jgi:hypothetical protein
MAARGRRSSGRGQLRRRGVVDGDGGGSGDTSEGLFGYTPIHMD